MLSRREVFRRVTGAIGLALVTQKLPRGLMQYGADAAPLSPTLPYYIIDQCTFVPGDPIENNPEWIEETDEGLVLRNRTLAIRERLTISQPVRLIVRDSRFIDVPLVISGGDGALLTGNYHEGGDMNEHLLTLSGGGHTVRNSSFRSAKKAAISIDQSTWRAWERENFLG